MRDFNGNRPWRVRKLAVAGCAAAALFAGTAVNAGTLTKASSSRYHRSTGSATLKWTAPTANTNGSALTDLAGYHVYYGKSPSSMTTSVTVTNAGTTAYTVSNLPAGTWYFAVNAYTTSGSDSALSNTGSKSIP